jgi:hypothetical protein
VRRRHCLSRINCSLCRSSRAYTHSSSGHLVEGTGSVHLQGSRRLLSAACAVSVTWFHTVVAAEPGGTDTFPVILVAGGKVLTLEGWEETVEAASQVEREGRTRGGSLLVCRRRRIARISLLRRSCVLRRGGGDGIGEEGRRRRRASSSRGTRMACRLVD